MFGGRPTQKRANNPKNNSEFVIDNIEHLLHDNFNENDNINDDDLNDPDLMNQLNALASSTKMESQAKTKKPAKKEVPQVSMDIDLDAYSALAQGDDDIEVELDEKDFTDPNLLSELSSLSQIPMEKNEQTMSTTTVTTTTTTVQPKPDEKTTQLMNMGFSQKQAKKALDMFDNDMERATNYLLDAPSTIDDDDHIANTDYPMDQDTNILIDTTMTDNDNENNTIENKKLPSSISHVTTAETLSSSDKLDQNVSNNNNDKDVSALDLKSQSQHYQQLALAAKRQGDKKLAIAYLRESKVLMQLYQQQQQQQQSLVIDKPQDELNINNNNNNNNKNDTQTPLIKEDEIFQENEVMTRPALSSSNMASQPSSSSSPSIATPSPQQTSRAINLNDSSEVSSTLSTQHINLQQEQELLQQIIQLQKEYKEAAIHYKNLGNLMIAKEMVQTSKSLLKTGIQVKQGGGSLSSQEIASIKAKLPHHPDMTLGDGKLRTVQPVTSFQQPTIEQVETQLTYQIDVCHNLEIQHRTSSSITKSSKDIIEQQKQAALLPLKQAFAADLMTIKSLREQENPSSSSSSSSSSLPSLHYEQVDYSYNHILDHLALNQMELKILKGTGIQTLDIGTDVEPFVTWDFAGWPPENTAQAQLNKGETPIVKGINPVFDFTTVIPIVRSNRVFIRHVQRKKLTLEVYHNKYNYGFLRRPVFIGKIMIPLEGLLTKSSIRGWFDLIDNNRKKLGGKLEIQLNIREPLNGQEIIKRSERWLILDGLSQQTSQLLYSAGLTQVLYVSPNIPNSSTNNITTSVDTTTTTVTMETTPTNLLSSSLPIIPKEESISSSSSPIPSKNSLQKEKVISSSSSSSSPQVTAELNSSSELENAEDELNNVDNIVSNMVLEHEIELANAALGGLSSQGSRSKEDWNDRKQALEIKMNMLVIQVQTGMLDMETYLEQVQARMEKDKQLALIFKKNHRLDLAKVALTRKKIMQDELDEARAAMAAQQQEEE